MARTDATQIDVLLAIIDRLRTQLNLSESRCYFANDPDDLKMPPAGDYWLAFSLDDGTFPDDLQIGGGAQQCTEDGSFTISMFSRIHTDEAGTDKNRLVHAVRGILEVKRLVMRALVQADPTLDDGSTFVRQQIPIWRCSKPVTDQKKWVTRMELVFGLSFDWDLT